MFLTSLRGTREDKFLPIHPLQFHAKGRIYIKFVRETQKKKGRENIKCCWIPFVKATRLQIEIILREEMDYVQHFLMNLLGLIISKYIFSPFTKCEKRK